MVFNKENFMSLNCFHCGQMIYDIGELYEIKLSSHLYCTNCNISIKNQKEEVRNA